MNKVFIRRLTIVIFYALAGILSFILLHEIWSLILALIFAFLTIILDWMLYAKRGVFLYALIGLAAGLFAGHLLFVVIDRLFLNLLTETIHKTIAALLDPYITLLPGVLGFYLPLHASTSTYSLDFSAGNIDNKAPQVELKLLDTSVIIDGRIADIAKTGFISGTLVVPKFVLNEIQALADSQDPIKRSRARRGLDILNSLKEVQNVNLKISSRDFTDVRGVDAKLIRLGKEIHASIMTNDYNLNKVAKLEGIQILNLNDLSNALKPVLLPGEEFELDVIKEGKEINQGVGYLADGTMVVVAAGSKLIGKTVKVKVTSILQTSAGRIVFTDPKR